jgi:RimJ/RimL family protein N-acetyltransferase
MHISDGKIALRDFLVDDIHRKIEWINDPKNHKYLHYEIPLEYDKTLQWFYGRDLSKRQDLVVEYEGVPVGVIGLVAIDRVS